MKTAATPRGRPATSPLTRAEQLREAKRAQRQRERRAGLRTIELRLPGEQAMRLRTAMKRPGFESALNRFLDNLVIDLERWPGLRELAWNRADRWIPSEEAFSIYERNWRFVDTSELSQDELDLIERLKQQFGGGMLNA